MFNTTELSKSNSIIIPDNSITIAADIGGSHVKITAILDEPASALGGVARIPSIGILSSSIVDDLISIVASFTEKNGIKNEWIKDYRISITGKVTDDGSYIGHLNRVGVPSNLKELLEAKTGKKVYLVNDGGAWGIGAMLYLRSIKPDALPPVGVISLGTGVGFSLWKSKNRIGTIELTDTGFDWSNLFNLAGNGKKGENWKLHENMGKPHFDHVMEKGWTRTDIIKDYSQRAALMLKEIERKFPRISSWCIGGGYSSYIDKNIISRELVGDVILLRYPDVECNEDLFPLFGAYGAVSVSVEMMTCTSPQTPVDAEALQVPQPREDGNRKPTDVIEDIDITLDIVIKIFKVVFKAFDIFSKIK